MTSGFVDLNLPGEIVLATLKCVDGRLHDGLLVDGYGACPLELCVATMRSVCVMILRALTTIGVMHCGL